MPSPYGFADALRARGTLGLVLATALVVECGGLVSLDQRAGALERTIAIQRESIRGAGAPIAREDLPPPPGEVTDNGAEPRIPGRSPALGADAGTAFGRSPPVGAPTGADARGLGPRPDRAEGVGPPSVPLESEEFEKLQDNVLDSLEAFAADEQLDAETTDAIYELTADLMEQRAALVQQMQDGEISAADLRKEIRRNFEGYYREISSSLGEEAAAAFTEEVLPAPPRRNHGGSEQDNAPPPPRRPMQAPASAESQ